MLASMPMPLDPEVVLAAASRYDHAYDEPIAAMVDPVRTRGYLTRDEFIRLGRWKTPRPLRLYEANSPQQVKQVTAIALTTDVEDLRINALLSLQGVAYPVASTILHWFHMDPYPILDVRAQESLGLEAKSYTPAFWRQYVQHWREHLAIAGVDKRTFDRALWQWSKDRLA
jgi:hypothetical protein